jgi:hypothetical protein
VEVPHDVPTSGRTLEDARGGFRELRAGGMIVASSFADPTKDAAGAREAVGMRRKVYGAAAAREAVVLVVLEVVVFVAFAAAVGARPARLAVGALAFAGLAAIVHLSATFDDEASGVTVPSAASGPPPPGAEGSRCCAGGLQRPRW